MLLKTIHGLLGSLNWLEGKNITTVFCLIFIRSFFGNYNSNSFVACNIFCLRALSFLSTISMLVSSANKTNLPLGCLMEDIYIYIYIK